MKMQSEMLIGLQSALLVQLLKHHGKEIPPRSEWPVTIRVVLDALRDTNMIKMVEGRASLTDEGYQIADKLVKAQQRASNNLKSVPEDQIQTDMQLFLSIGINELRKEFSIPDPTITYRELKPISVQEIKMMGKWKPAITAADDIP